MPFLWFHAFDRKPGSDGAEDDIDAIVRALHDGPTCEQPDKDTTQTNEDLLGIKPPCVYAYLGLCTDVFGDNALALHSSAEGHVSPFDTGGLVKWINPVATFDPPSLKAAFVASYTWEAKHLPELLGQYPGEGEQLRAEYLRGNAPPQSGPHLVWTDRVPADMWSGSGNTWQAWTWELRATGRLSADGLVYWSCAPSLYEAILLAALRIYGESDPKWAVDFAGKYREGGSTNLADDMFADQLAA